MHKNNEFSIEYVKRIQEAVEEWFNDQENIKSLMKTPDEKPLPMSNHFLTKNKSIIPFRAVMFGMFCSIARDGGTIIIDKDHAISLDAEDYESFVNQYGMWLDKHGAD